MDDFSDVIRERAVVETANTPGRRIRHVQDEVRKVTVAAGDCRHRFARKMHETGVGRATAPERFLVTGEVVRIDFNNIGGIPALASVAGKSQTRHRDIVEHSFAVSPDENDIAQVENAVRRCGNDQVSNCNFCLKFRSLV